MVANCKILLWLIIKSLLIFEQIIFKSATVRVRPSKQNCCSEFAYIYGKWWFCNFFFLKSHHWPGQHTPQWFDEKSSKTTFIFTFIVIVVAGGVQAASFHENYICFYLISETIIPSRSTFRLVTPHVTN